MPIWPLGSVIKAAFGSDMGVDNDPIDDRRRLTSGIDVSGITPSRDRTLEEVKRQVEARWREDEIATRLKAKAAELLDKLKGGNGLEDVAKAEGPHRRKGRRIKRGKPPGNVSAPWPVRSSTPPRTPSAAPRATSRASGSSFASPMSPRRNSRRTRAKESIVETCAAATADDVFGEYLARLEDELGTSVNPRRVGAGARAAAPRTPTEC